MLLALWFMVCQLDENKLISVVNLRCTVRFSWFLSDYFNGILFVGLHIRELALDVSSFIILVTF